jgi:hypothetical protein
MIHSFQEESPKLLTARILLTITTLAAGDGNTTVQSL